MLLDWFSKFGVILMFAFILSTTTTAMMKLLAQEVNARTVFLFVFILLSMIGVLYLGVVVIMQGREDEHIRALLIHISSECPHCLLFSAFRSGGSSYAAEALLLNTGKL